MERSARRSRTVHHSPGRGLDRAVRESQPRSWTEDDLAASDENRGRIAEMVGAPVAYGRQVHGARCAASRSRPAPRASPRTGDRHPASRRWCWRPTACRSWWPARARSPTLHGGLARAGRRDRRAAACPSCVPELGAAARWRPRSAPAPARAATRSATRSTRRSPRTAGRTSGAEPRSQGGRAPPARGRRGRDRRTTSASARCATRAVLLPPARPGRHRSPGRHRVVELIHGLTTPVAALERVRAGSPATGRDPGVEILAAVKYLPVEQLPALARGGVTLVGENRAQELVAKAERAPGRFTWDFIGALQSRKVAAAARPRARYIHSVASDSALEQLGRHGTAGDPGPRRGQRRRRGGQGGDRARPSCRPSSSGVRCGRSG